MALNVQTFNRVEELIREFGWITGSLQEWENQGSKVMRDRQGCKEEAWLLRDVGNTKSWERFVGGVKGGSEVMRKWGNVLEELVDVG